MKTWTHFFVNVPKRFVKKSTEAGQYLGEQRSTFGLFLHGLKEITEDSVDTVLELIAQKSLYRGEEHEHTLKAFSQWQKEFKRVAMEEQENFVWSLIKAAPMNVSRVRNTAIGTLLVDLSAGMELDDAVKSFEAKVAPTNYKRPTALVTKSMIDKAKKTVKELGLTSALERRYATINDITINNILFADRSTPAHLSLIPFRSGHQSGLRRRSQSRQLAKARIAVCRKSARRGRPAMFDMEELPGYVAVTRDGPCLDDEGKQVSSCAFRHNDDKCRTVACGSRNRSDGRMVQFHRLHTAKEAALGDTGDLELLRLRRVVQELEKLVSALEAHPRVRAV